MTRKLSKNLMFTVAGTLLLASCGGGGGSTAAPTAPITPTSNDSLDDIQVSEDFNSFSSIVLVKVEGATETIDSSNESQSSGAVVGVDADLNTATDFTVTIVNQGDDGNNVNFDFAFEDSMLDTSSATLLKYVSGDNTLVLAKPGEDLSIPFSAETVNLSYVTYGLWAKSAGTVATNGFDKAFGFVTFGVRTDDVPTNGTANYTGLVIGQMYKPSATPGDPDLYVIDGQVGIDVDFGAANNNVVATFTNMAQSRIGATDHWVNFTMTGDLSNGLFSGNATDFTDAETGDPVAGYSGSVSGAFYGPNAQEVGGTWSVAGPGEEAAGAFVGEQ